VLSLTVDRAAVRLKLADRVVTARWPFSRRASPIDFIASWDCRCPRIFCTPPKSRWTQRSPHRSTCISVAPLRPKASCGPSGGAGHYWAAQDRCARPRPRRDVPATIPGPP